MVGVAQTRELLRAVDCPPRILLLQTDPAAATLSIQLGHLLRKMDIHIMCVLSHAAD